MTKLALGRQKTAKFPKNEVMRITSVVHLMLELFIILIYACM